MNCIKENNEKINKLAIHMRISFKVCCLFINDHCPSTFPTISKFAQELHTFIPPPIMVGSFRQHVYQLSFVNIVHLPILSQNSSPSFMFFQSQGFCIRGTSHHKGAHFHYVGCYHSYIDTKFAIEGAHQQIFKPYKYGQIFKFMVKFH